MNLLMPPSEGCAELGSPIIAMTIVLVAVYVPIGFQGGLTGALFTEFAFTLVGAVVISAVVALTLSPMMCSRLFTPMQHENPDWEHRLTARIDRIFVRVHNRYEKWLRGSLNYLSVTVVLPFLSLVAFISFSACPKRSWHRKKI